MADITVTANHVGPAIPEMSEIFNASVALSSTIAVGDAVYFDSNGYVVASDASAAGTAKFAGIVIGRMGRGVTILKRGILGGFAVSGLAYGAPVYLSDTAGKLADGVGTVTLEVGSIVPISDGSRTKALYVQADWLAL